MDGWVSVAVDGHGRVKWMDGYIDRQASFLGSLLGNNPPDCIYSSGYD